MSLLMDALKKAEEAKRLAQAGSDGASDDARNPADTAGATRLTPPGSLPKLPARLELLDDQFALPGANGASRRTEPAPPTAELEAEQEAAAQLFAVKAQPSPKLFLIGLSIVTLAAIAAIAGYFWWQLQPKSSLAVQSSVPHKPVPPAAVAPPPPSTAPSSPPEKVSAPETKVASAAPPSAPARSAGIPERPSVTPQDPPPLRPQAPAAPLFRNRPENAPANAAPLESATPAIRVEHVRPGVEPAVVRGYRLFQAGDMAAARQEYEAALRADPHNRDALHGLAAISLRQGKAEAAEGLYRRALEADPNDATAAAGLLSLRPEVDPRQAEQQLSAITANRTEAHAAQFALGNLYAARGQWHDAQEAYFQAYRGDPGNADYQFNLAVSLDHLRQARPALQHYQGALAAAAKRPAAFGSAEAAARVRELQQELQP